jgi:predicted nucleotidyltransferase
MLSLADDRPIDPAMLAVRRHVDRAAQALALTYLLVGAMARDILLHGVFGLATGRATRDVDVGVVLDTWPQFEALKTHLVGTGTFLADPGTTHRLRYRPDPMHPGTPLDLIPFGGVEHRAHDIAWPPDRAVVMNVAGYREALTTAIAVEVEPGLVVRVVSWPGLAILKLIAWTDRGAQDRRDAIDLAMLLRHYGSAGTEDRLYGAEHDVLEAVGFNLELAGARLLGIDASRLATAPTRGQILALLDDAARRDRLVLDLARGVRAVEDPVAEAEALLGQFQAGFRAP